MLTVGSLFSGIGGLELGLERTEHFTTKWQVENDTYATRVLERHWPNAKRWDDVQTFPLNTTSAREWYVDLICGGFPCQDISYAGRGAGLAGERSGLFYEAARIIGILEPRYVLLENVSALLGRGLGNVLGTLASFGYDAEWHCIPAAAVGAPHIRDRLFILAYWTCSDDAASREESRRASPQFRNLRGRDRECRGWWAPEPDVGRVAHGVPARVHRLKCLGNAVVPQVAEWLGEYIWHCLENNERNS